MAYIALLVSVLVLASANGKPSTFEDGRIVGGTDTTIEKRPYQVSLQHYSSHRCGGSIIAAKSVVTAAHCVDGVSASGLTIRAGSATQGSGGDLKKVSAIYKHLDYNSLTINNDIAVLVLSEALVFSSKIKAVTFDWIRPPADTSVIVSGWGALREGGSGPSQLQEATVEIVSQASCKRAYGNNKITDQMICAGLPEGKVDACQGDSGGPLVIEDGNNFTLVGIVSWGNGCARKGYPGVYTDVSKFKKFILDYIS